MTPLPLTGSKTLCPCSRVDKGCFSQHLEVDVPELGDVGADDLVSVQEDDLLEIQREQHVQKQDLVGPDDALLVRLQSHEVAGWRRMGGMQAGVGLCAPVLLDQRLCATLGCKPGISFKRSWFIT